jgi:zinc transport system ATP-binding protein
VLVELKHATFGYGLRPVVQTDELSVSAGGCLGIFGPNGSGKTTLVRGMTGLLPPLSGRVSRAPSARFSYLPQHRALERHWPMSGLDAAALAVSARSRFGWIGKQMRHVQAAMEKMGVAELSQAQFAKLSGGQQQRVLLAGALAAEPTVLVLDEPTDGLDVHSRQSLLAYLRGQMGEGLALVIITHEVEDLLYLADNVAWLHPGQEAGEASDVEIINPVELARRMTRARGAS